MLFTAGIQEISGQDGTVFDTNIQTSSKKKNAKPLSFKVGIGKVIRGWDEALLTMSKGEKGSGLEIEPEWAYERKDSLMPKFHQMQNLFLKWNSGY